MESREQKLQNDLVAEALIGKRIENSKAKHEWWMSTLKFIGGGLIVILSGFVNNYSKTYELETKITSLQKDILSLEIENNSIKKLNKMKEKTSAVH
jgi:hypothetical protein